jgi:trans-aconitate methyltransferase
MASWLALVPKGLDWLALEGIYLSDGMINLAEPELENGEIIADRFREWLNCNECSVFMQQRRDIVTEILKKCSGRIVSLGSGSALAEISALTENRNAQLICADKNEFALQRAQRFAAKAGIEIQTIADDVFMLYAGKFHADVLYSIGCAGNYLPEKQLTAVLAKWLSSLKSGGKLVTDFINLDEDTEKCLTEIVGWTVAKNENERGLRVYTPEHFAGITENVLAVLNMKANIEISDYRYGGVMTVTRL